MRDPSSRPTQSPEHRKFLQWGKNRALRAGARRGMWMKLSISAFLVPVALTFAPPQTAASRAYQQGLFCDSADLVAAVVERVDRGGDPDGNIKAINQELDRTACLFSAHTDVLAEPVRFERRIGANNTTYGIYQVKVWGIGHQPTEIGDMVWTFASPRVMYTLGKAPADSAAAR
jgi:hypothetical protein